MVETLEAELQVLQEQLSISPDHFQEYIEQERKYLEGLKSPSPTVSRKIQYMSALNEVNQHRYVIFI